MLDRLVLSFIKSVFNNSYMQFATLTSLWIIAEIIIPSKKVKR